jgi:hypothetical protein
MIDRKTWGMLIVLIGVILLLDELWMFGVPIGSPGWLLGDWGWMHTEPLHHWMLGVAMIVGGVCLLR